VTQVARASDSTVTDTTVGTLSRRNTHVIGTSNPVPLDVGAWRGRRGRGSGV